jgi:hypothetical protein
VFDSLESYAASLTQQQNIIRVGAATVELENSASNEVHLLPTLRLLPETVQYQLWVSTEIGDTSVAWTCSKLFLTTMSLSQRAVTPSCLH